MLSPETRIAVLRLREEGLGTRTIAQTLHISRESVRKILAQGPHSPERPSALDPHHSVILDLEQRCKGNLVRVQEELEARHQIEVPYSTLTHYCRRHKIGEETPKASGTYTFPAGAEMQHDTSPHRVTVGGTERLLQCASLVMCFSRRRYIQCYPVWNRFVAKVFLTRAIQALGGAAERCMLDNSTVLVTGTGAAAKAVPEMVPFEQLFHFRFVAHEVGDANRSGRVERPFHHVETNFYPGREFADLSDLNRQLEAWCGRYNSTFNKHYQFTPDEIGAAEAPYLQALPRWIPEPTEVHPRKVDVEGYIQLHSNRYSVPEEEIGQQVEVHQSWERVKIYLRSRLLGDHPRLEGRNQRSTLPEHRRQRDRKPAEPSPEERQLQGSPELSEFCERLRKKYGGQGLKGIRTLYRMWRDYPDSALNPALRKALDHNLLDLERVESMVIQQVRSDYFKLEVNDG